MNKNLIYNLLKKYCKKYLYHYLIKTILMKDYKTYKSQFINKITTCIIQHIQIMILIFYDKGSDKTIYTLVNLFIDNFNKRIQIYMESHKNKTDGKIDDEIISIMLKYEIDKCLLNSFSFYHYIK
jgi:hypothetical protein